MKTPLDCIMERENNPQMIGEYVCLKTRMSAGDAHYAGELVEGAHIVTAWGDVGTELHEGFERKEQTSTVSPGNTPKLDIQLLYLLETGWNTADTSKRLVTLPLLANSSLTSG